MTKADAVQFFGSGVGLAKAIGVNKATISQWGDYPPYPRQFQIQVLTKGRLKAEDAK